ncbi:hypothetical protein PG985_011076 [Apiospora marii]|uniref:histidine kinase n=1 Tax=Apiospora marii TaxID=335849 RepID=A0ABR1SSM7_9PEZI
MGSRVRESVREREVLSYDPTLWANITYNDTAVPIPNAQLRTSNDPVLTSLAQLGACRTGTARGIISLFDKKWQYIVAEATPSLSLLPSLGSEERDGEELWLCQTAIPRNHGVCEWTLLYDGEPSTCDEELPVTFVNDLQGDDRFCMKPYCAPGSPARFYASVPIRSPGGINIGVYCLMHTEVISEDDAKAAMMDVVIRHVSRTVMTHLESRRSAIAFKRSENMMLGVASYISNDNTATVGFQTNSGPPRAKQKASNPAIPAASCQVDDGQTSNQPTKIGDVLSSDTYVEKGRGGNEDTRTEIAASGGHTVVPASRPGPPPLTISSTSVPSRLSLSSDDDDLSLGGIFTRAANVIRESLNIGDVTFFNASSGSYGARVDTSPNRDQPTDPLTTSSSSDEMSLQSRGHDSGTCHILGTSRATISDNNITSRTGPPVTLPASLLSSLLKRHPRGRVFNFDEHGALQTSESSEDSAKSVRDAIPTPKPQKPPSKTRWSRQRQAEVLQKMCPGARSICFAPVWDDKRERWYAGGLACIYEHNRVFASSVELSYLRAFGTLLMADVHRLEATRSHQAQSDVLGSISHELRSPLHGLIISTELLADTHIDTFQGNILHTLETCGRTLLDTVDHLLDYSKVNHFLNSDKRRKARGIHGKTLSVEDGMTAQVTDVRLDTLVEEVVESVFAGFHRMSTDYSLHNDRRKATDPDIGGGISSGSGLGEMLNHLSLSPVQDDEKTLSVPASVAVYFYIEPSESYKCRTVAGAIRRVVMNLFGNSLKYTERGRIEVRLSRDLVATRRRGAKQNMIRIVVEDTGKGMSQDFLAHDLYKPFAQADQLSAGTGLGLSLVKKLVSSLGGEISVKSQLGVGSAVTVLLPLPSADHELAEHKEEEAFRAQRQMLKGLRVCLVGHATTPSESTSNASVGVSAVEKICKGWLGMEVVSESSGFTPDVIMCVESSLDVTLETQAFAVKPPIVVICPNAVVAHSRTMNSALSDNDQVYEFISQPTGPRKLARVLLLAFNRWLELQDVSTTISSRQSVSTPSADTTSISTLPTNFGPGWLDPSGMASVATQTQSYFPANQSPRRLSVAVETEPYPWEKGSGCLARVTSCPPSLALPPVMSSGPGSRSPSSKPAATLGAQFLLVDDNPINLRILCAYMKKLDRAFTTAVDGIEAVESFKADPGRYACIFMDINMPRLDGLQATRQIRSHERDTGASKACPVFALTGLASAETQREAFESGIDLFLAKPVKLKELSEILRSRGLI